MQFHENGVEINSTQLKEVYIWIASMYNCTQLQNTPLHALGFLRLVWWAWMYELIAMKLAPLMGLSFYICYKLSPLTILLDT